MKDVTLSYDEFMALKRRCTCDATQKRMNYYANRANEKEAQPAEPKARKK